MSPTAKLGAFMLAALIVAGVLIIRIERIRLGGAADRQRVQATFPQVAGLDEKSPVRVAGVRVGIVERIGLHGDRALVTLELDQPIQLRQGARAAVRLLGLLGDQYIELLPGPESAPPLPPGTILDGSSPTGFDQVLDTAGDVGGEIREIVASLRASLGGAEGQRRIDEILDNVRELTAAVKTVVQENRTTVRATADNLRDFSETLKSELPRLAAKLNHLADGVDGIVVDNRENISETLANIKELSARLRLSADNLNQITTRIAQGDGSIGKLVNDPTTVDNLNSTLKSVENGVATLRNTIGRVERWRLDLDLRAAALPQTDESRTSIGLDLSTSDARFLRFGVVDAPPGRVKNTIETVTTLDPDATASTIVRETRRETDDFTFNAQFGHRWGATTLRAGLFESRGGFGLDRSLARDRVGLTFEAYDFDRDERAPHLRLEGRCFLTKNVYTFAGWDDLRWRQNRSWFIGGGVTWTDEDLKYLLGTAASAVNP